MSKVSPITNQPSGSDYPDTVLREWNSGLCGCCSDCCGCIFGWWCPSCLAASIAGRVGESMCVGCCLPGGVLALRTKIRTMYGIQGSICVDACCVLNCCCLCALCQMDRELKSMGIY